MIEAPSVKRPVEPRFTRGRSRTAKVLITLVIVLIFAAGVIFWGINARVKAAANAKAETLDLAIPSVSVTRPKPGAPQDEVVLPGNIEAFTDSPIYARASGYLKKWYVDIGGHAKAGQVLAEIDAPELDQQVMQAKATLQQARQTLQQAAANLEQGKANEDLARITARRWQVLVTKGAVSKQENDQYQSQFQAQAANVQALEQAVEVARSNIAADEANLGRLHELQGYEIVRAPFDGIVTQRNIDIGALINAGNGGPAQELFHMAATAKLRVYVSVPQMYSRSAVPGLKADLTLSEFPGRRFHGVLVRNADAIDPATRTLLTEVDVDNASGELKPGAYAEVHFMLPPGSLSLIIPVNTLLFRSEGLRVGVVRAGNKVHLMPITLGRDYGTEVEVVAGINPDDSVILDPPDSLADGEVVDVVPGGSPAPVKPR
ncbi:MAG TPA: efflux RND transporter periplasmic adaptor subunit [Bryobacteraceae bacterium]|nr:efflux RND transporter periplasmic adaptor subunit [Bryobacteraceae bacterium]